MKERKNQNNHIRYMPVSPL